MMNAQGANSMHQHLQQNATVQGGARKAEEPPTADRSQCMSPDALGDDIFNIIQQAMGEKQKKVDAADAAKRAELSQALTVQVASDQARAHAAAGGQRPASRSGNFGAEKMYRVFDCNAINAPGAMYKAVKCCTDTTAREFVGNILERFGCEEEADLFELRYAVEPEAQTSKKAKLQEPPRVLHADDCPVMVAEWFTDRPRRFELYRKSNDAKDNTTRQKKWTTYWSSPSSIKKKFTFRKKKAGQPEL